MEFFKDGEIISEVVDVTKRVSVSFGNNTDIMKSALGFEITSFSKNYVDIFYIERLKYISDIKTDGGDIADVHRLKNIIYKFDNTDILTGMSESNVEKLYFNKGEQEVLKLDIFFRELIKKNLDIDPIFINEFMFLNISPKVFVENINSNTFFLIDNDAKFGKKVALFDYENIIYDAYSIFDTSDTIVSVDSENKIFRFKTPSGYVYDEVYEGDHSDFQPVGIISYDNGLVILDSIFMLENANVGSESPDDYLGTLNFFFSFEIMYPLQYNSFTINIPKNKFLSSSNSTFKDQTKPFITKACLYNNNNEVIAVASLSTPVPTDVETTLVIEDYTPLV